MIKEILYIVFIFGDWVTNSEMIWVGESTPRWGRVDTPAEVGHFEVAGDADEQVLRFDVAMDHALRVAILKGGRELRDITRRAGIVEAPVGSALKLLVELSSRCQLEHEVHLLFVGKECVQFQNIGMAIRKK